MKKRNNKKKSHGISLAAAVGVVVLAVVLSSSWPTTNNNSSNDRRSLQDVLKHMCRKGVAYCPVDLYAKGRSLHVKEFVPQGQVLFHIPIQAMVTSNAWFMLKPDRHYKQDYAQSTHAATGHAIGADAGLAAHLAVWIAQQDGMPTTHQNDIQGTYLKYLPSAQEYYDSHPLFQNASTIAQWLGCTAFCTSSFAYQIMIHAHQDLYKSEYQALEAEYPELFTPQKVSYKYYLLGHAIRSSRCFAIPNPHQVALIPLLDALDHDALQANVQYRFSQSSNGMTVIAARDIRPSDPLYISYGGTKSQAALLANYAFVLTEDSAPTAVSLAVHHAIRPIGQPSPIQDLIPYLAYFDGYESCPTDSSMDDEAILAYERTKLQILHQHLAHNATYWTIVLDAPNRPPSTPSGQATTLLRVLATARFVAASIDSGAPSLDQMRRLLHVEKGDFYSAFDDLFAFKSTSSDWEDRTIAVLHRWTSIGLGQYQHSPVSVVDDDDNAAVGSLEWNLRQVGRQEERALQTIQDFCRQQLDQGSKRPDFFRSSPCPNASIFGHSNVDSSPGS